MPRKQMRFAIPLLASASILFTPPLAAQDEDDPAPENDQEAVTANEADSQVYTPDFFSQFAPRNALDMVTRIPGFTIEDGNQGQRGLGQANQNVIVNGERFSSKSDSLFDQLQRIPASDVVRIEIVDGNALDIPGLSGQVANVIYRADGTSGQFTWRGGFRAHNTEAQLYGGEVSLTGKSGRLGYTISLSNVNNRFGADGPTIISDGDGNVIEEQFSKLSGKFDNPRLSTNWTYDFGGETIANLNLSYGVDYFRVQEPETGINTSGLTRERWARNTNDQPNYEIGGDFQFPVGSGTLKLIGLERFRRSNFTSVVTDSFSDGRDDTGFRFEQTSGIGERIGRFEYGWNMWKADWQVSGEAAFNRLGRAAELFELDASGRFLPLNFDAGNGGVTEDRYEAILSFSKQLSPKVSFQATAGGEYSKIEQTGSAANSRTFQRPKGSAAITWKPQSDLDLSLELRRGVGQLSFGDFLASVSLNTENESGGNNELQPDQSWDLDLQVNKRLGPWGSAQLQVQQAWFEDFIDFFPLPDGGEARGNIGNAQRLQVELNTTLQGEPIGWNGARLEVRAIQRWMNVTDPFTGLDRPFSQDLERLLNMNLRYDVPKSDWALGSGLFTSTNAPYSRRREVGLNYEGPTFLSLFVENKDVFGLTVSASYGNVLGARNKFDRVVFAEDRPTDDILFVESMDRRIGPIFRFSVSGNI